MTITEVESYYGKEAADWIRGKIADGTFKKKRFVVRFKNLKHKRGFLKPSDEVPIDEYGLVSNMSNKMWYSNTVVIEVEE